MGFDLFLCITCLGSRIGCFRGPSWWNHGQPYSKESRRWRSSLPFVRRRWSLRFFSLSETVFVFSMDAKHGIFQRLQLHLSCVQYYNFKLDKIFCVLSFRMGYWMFDQSFIYIKKHETEIQFFWGWKTIISMEDRSLKPHAIV